MITALIPFKPLSEAKSRLATILPPADRRALALAMLDDVLTALERSQRISQIIVTASDAAAQALVQSRNIEFLQDTSNGLNPAIQHVVNQLDPARPLLIMHADLPLVEEDDIDEFITMMPSGGVALAGSNDGGTTAAICAVPQRMHWSFGEQSLVRHLAAARAANIPVRSVREGPITFDIDRPVDLYRLLLDPGGRQTGRLLGKLHIGAKSEPTHE